MPIERVREYYRVNDFLFGALKWETITKMETTGKILEIICENDVEDVIVNGERYVKAKNNHNPL